MMRRQLGLRREETRNIHECARYWNMHIIRLCLLLSRKCDALGAKLSELRASVQRKLKETKGVSSVLLSSCVLFSHEDLRHQTQVLPEILVVQKM